MSRRSSFRVALLALPLVLLAACASEKEPAPRPSWSEDVVAKFETLPVQDRGRLKPLSTWASYLLLRLNNRSSFKTPWGETLGPTEWLLDCLFYPELAKDYEIFLVANREALAAVGLHETGKKRRDRYSFADLLPYGHKLDELGRSYARIEQKDRSLVEGQIVSLWENFLEYYSLDQAFAFARAKIDLREAGLAPLFDGKETATFSDVLARVRLLSAAYQEVEALAGGADPEVAARSRERLQAFGRLFQKVDAAAGAGHGLALLPPTGTREQREAYYTPRDVFEVAFTDPQAVERQIGLLGQLEAMAASRVDRAAFARQTEELHAGIAGLAAERGEYEGIPLEVEYYRLDLFYRSLILFVLSFVVAAISWLLPRVRWLGWLVPVTVGVPTLVLIAGIVMRCVILDRPPVTHLYETIPYITAIGVLAAMVMEWIHRTRVGIGVAAVLGTAGMFIAQKYAARGEDTMQVLVAVLDTNFWLATHVTIINIGYAAGLLAGLIAHVWLLGKLLGLRRGDRAFYRSIGKMVYGTVCFALVFSVIGTILGGVWANDSWGRFWGWDPKENGALMIAIWSIVILHARMGGYLRDFGVSMMSVALGMVVAFSWWHVNLLGVGLHSYGFTSGVLASLIAFYAIETAVMLLGWVGHLMDQRGAETVATTADQPRIDDGRGVPEPLPEH